MKYFCVESFVTFLSLSLISTVMSASESSKRGCSAFGHACFGGHGKRFDSDMSEQSSERGGASEQSFQDELSRNEQLLLLAGGLGLKSRERERERERDRGDRDRNPLLFGGATAGSGGVPVPSTPVTYQSLIKALLECQSIKQIYLAQAFAKTKKAGDITNFSSELGGI